MLIIGHTAHPYNTERGDVESCGTTVRRTENHRLGARGSLSLDSRTKRTSRSGLPTRVGTIFDLPEPAELMELTVIVPARNEEDCLGACLESLVQQSDEVFALGRDWELIVVDDHSTDRTAEIGRAIPGVMVIHRQAGKGMDRQGKCDLDGGPKSARPVAAVYRRGYGA